MSKDLLSIGELSKLTNVNIKSLRYYDKLGILIPVYIAPSGYRYYSTSQIILVDAIQLCVELGIPLKEFHHYYNKSNGGLYYGRLFDDGTAKAELKFQQIQSRLERLKQMQEEIKRCEKVQKNNGIIKCRIPAMNLWLTEYKSNVSISQQISNSYFKLYSDMEKYSIMTGCDTGRLAINKNGENTFYTYITIDILDKNIKLPENILKIPPSEYYCKAANENDFLNYNNAFPAFKNKNKIIIEAELFTPEYNISQPKFELRCIEI